MDRDGRPVRGLGLLSGGLDSMLAARLLMEQGVETVAVIFKTPFFGSARGEAAAARLGIQAVVLDITEPHLAMVKSPAHGYGRNMNPCIDCHAMMFATAGELLRQHEAHFLFSGEVLGQRPMSQNYSALGLVERCSGFEGRVLRPLSARLLPETRVEKDGLVDRSRLQDIQGRSRRRQMELAEAFGLTEFPNPAGGCLLTDPGFSSRLRELFSREPACSALDVERLKVGRHFRLACGVKAVVGRNQRENETLEDLKRPGDFLLKVKDIPGPVTLLGGGADGVGLAAAAGLTVRYSKAAGEGPFPVTVTGVEVQPREILASPLPPHELERCRVD